VRLGEFVDRGVVAVVEERLPVERPHKGMEEGCQSACNRDP
jgi:hypothetical protein